MRHTMNPEDTTIKKDSGSRMIRRMICLILAATMLLVAGCGRRQSPPDYPASENIPSSEPTLSPESATPPAKGSSGEKEAADDKRSGASTAPGKGSASPGESGSSETLPSSGASEKNGEIMVLFTSDVHCGMVDGFGYAGLEQIRESLEAMGYTTLLVDDGDAIQGGVTGTLTRGEAIIRVMNALKYDVVIPGNHDFDYGVDRLMELTEMADFPYICCNFKKEGKRVFPDHLIKEVCGVKIGFVGVTTPQTLTASNPKIFLNDKGEPVYDFSQDETGEGVYSAVQSAVDSARAEGAEVVYLMAHLGNESVCSPWTYADVISNTTGIDAVFDGHSHDTEQVTMKNKDGADVKRVAVGYKLNCIGYSHVTADKTVAETDAWSWPNQDGMTKLIMIRNRVSAEIEKVQAKVDEKKNEVIAKSEVELTIDDPVAKDEKGQPVRMVRRAETNLGDLCADSLRDQLGTDIGITNGGNVRNSVDKGDITYGEILDVCPFMGTACVVEATGQQILDALEWGARSVPDECGSFLQVSGMSYDIDVSVPSCCLQDERGMNTGFKGERRVKNVTVGSEPIDPKKTYTVGSTRFVLLENGDGMTAFDGAELLEDNGKVDNQILIDYIAGTLGGVVGEEYADPYGAGRIRIVGE